MEFSVLLSFHGFPPLWLALLIGVKWMQVGSGCPAECTCEQWKVDCKAKNLLHVPSAIPLNTKELILARNNITHLPVIRINYLSDLVYLDCSHNRLTVDLHFVFTGTTKLIYLDLSFNGFTHLTQTILSRLETLMLLNLSGNRNLTLIEKEAFRGNPLLMFLDLSGCGLHNVDYGTFQNLSNLHTLGMNNNPWRCDCLMLEFCSWVEDTIIELSNIADIICEEPTNMQGLQIFGTVQHDLHFACLVHLHLDDFLNMALIAFFIFVGGTFAAWLVGISTVMYYHPVMKAEDESDDEEYRMF